METCAVFKQGNCTTYNFSGGYNIGDIVKKTVAVYPNEPHESYDLVITDKERIDYGAYVQNKYYLSNGEQQSVYEFECKYDEDNKTD